MKRLSIEAKFVALTLFFVTLLGFGTVHSLVDDETEALNNDRLSLQLSGGSSEVASATSEGMVGAKGRQPASIPKGKVKNSLSSLLSLDLSCRKKMESNFQISGQFVQFKGKNCLKDFKQERLEIVNTSNGSTASVFPYGHDLYQTDLIQLKAGVNEITIRHEAGGIIFQQTLQVTASAI